MVCMALVDTDGIVFNGVSLVDTDGIVLDAIGLVRLA